MLRTKLLLWINKLEEVSKEAEYYKIKSSEIESSRDKAIEKEKLMAMKYGIILSQNKELIIKLKKYKEDNEKLKNQIQEFKKREKANELSINDYYNIRLNSTTHKRDDSIPLLKRAIQTSNSSSSFSN